MYYNCSLIYYILSEEVISLLFCLFLFPSTEANNTFPTTLHFQPKYSFFVKISVWVKVFLYDFIRTTAVTGLRQSKMLWKLSSTPSAWHPLLHLEITWPAMTCPSPQRFSLNAIYYLTIYGSTASSSGSRKKKPPSVALHFLSRLSRFIHVSVCY